MDLLDRIKLALKEDHGFIYKLENLLPKEFLECWASTEATDNLITKAYQQLEENKLDEASNIHIQVLHALDENQTQISNLDSNSSNNNP